MMKPAVFLDRDGVINELILNTGTGEYEPPHCPDDLIIFPEVIESLRIFQDAGFELFLISNQPVCAKSSHWNLPWDFAAKCLAHLSSHLPFSSSLPQFTEPSPAP